MDNRPPFQKNDLVEMTCLDLNHLGLGVCKPQAFVVFVKNLLPGEKALVRITKVLKGYAYGHLVERLSTSDHRVAPVCRLFPQCGGCQLMHLDAKGQESYVFNKVKEALSFLDESIIEEPAPLKQAFHYRNKVMIPYDGGQAGFYRLNSHSIIDMEECFIQSDELNKIYGKIKHFLKERKDQEVSTIILREGTFTQEVMVALAVESRTYPYQQELVDYLTSQFPQIKSILLNVHKTRTNTLLSRENVLLYGKPYIHERINGLTYRLSLNSFFQVNSYQTEVLYQLVNDCAGVISSDRVLDLYCGVGTIGLSLARGAKEVVGVDIVPSAIEDAKVNAALNNLDNVSFYCMDASLFVSTYQEKIDVVVVDPPRKGLTESGISDIKRLAPDRLVYVSCNPYSLARDLKLLMTDFKVKRVIPVDMFGQTSHVETVVLMSRAN